MSKPAHECGFCDRRWEHQAGAGLMCDPCFRAYHAGAASQDSTVAYYRFLVEAMRAILQLGEGADFPAAQKIDAALAASDGAYGHVGANDGKCQGGKGGTPYYALGRKGIVAYPSTHLYERDTCNIVPEKAQEKCQEGTEGKMADGA